MKPILLLVYGFLLTISAFTQSNAFIEVTGSADSLVLPNQIYVRFGITEKEIRAKAQLEEIELKVISGLRSIGIDSEVQLSIQDQLNNIRQYALKITMALPENIC